MKKTLDTADVAERLGHHRNTVNKLRKRGEFPNAFKSCGRWKFPAGDVEAYIKRGKAANDHDE